MLTLIFLLAFPFALWGAWKNIQLAKASSAWPTTPGTITISKRRRVMLRAQPHIAYAYEVNGKQFTSQRSSFASFLPPKETDAILARYPVGQNVVVHHSPEKPAEAVLEAGNNRQVGAQFRTLLVVFVLLIMMNVGLYYLRQLEAK